MKEITINVDGQAVGIIGISYNDFCRCAPDELEAIFRAYSEVRQEDRQDEWERMRIAATIGIQPHVRRKITPQKLLPFAWNSKNKATTQKATAENMSPEDRKLRFEKLAKK